VLLLKHVGQNIVMCLFVTYPLSLECNSLPSAVCCSGLEVLVLFLLHDKYDVALCTTVTVFNPV